MEENTYKMYVQNTKYPSRFHQEQMDEQEYVKARTLELYSYLPQDSLEHRFQFVDIRDEIVQLNYKLLCWIASNTFVANPSATYDDKIQSCIVHFLEIWHKYKFAAKYRTDLSFAVFFKPRLSEEIQRELNTVKYSIERTLKMEAAAQLGIFWSKLTYDDLKHVKLPEDKMNALKAMFGVMYDADLSVHELYQKAAGVRTFGAEHLYSDNYDSIEGLLVHEMVEQESLLDDKTLLKISQINDIPYDELEKVRPSAEAKLKSYLVDKISITDSFG